MITPAIEHLLRHEEIRRQEAAEAALRAEGLLGWIETVHTERAEAQGLYRGTIVLPDRIKVIEVRLQGVVHIEVGLQGLVLREHHLPRHEHLPTEVPVPVPDQANLTEALLQEVVATVVRGLPVEVATVVRVAVALQGAAAATEAVGVLRAVAEV